MPRSILVVDDDERVRASVSRALSDENTSVRTADSAERAISGAVPGAGLTIVMVPVDGGETTTLLTHDQPGMAALSLSPDGRRAAFVSELSRKEIWILQGF